MSRQSSNVNRPASDWLPQGERGARSPVAWIRERSRRKRAGMFRTAFDLMPTTRVLDLGGWDGSHIRSVLRGTPVKPENVCVADISSDATNRAKERFGFDAVVLPEDGRLPFDDNAFDIVFCSSVLEHVTIPKEQVWTTTDQREFCERSRAHQSAFALEIARVGIGYFVQVPYRWFPVETHTWLPFVGYLGRASQVRVIRFTNGFWIKKTRPDFYLPTKADMNAYFPGSQLRYERSMGMVKSLIAVKPCT